MGFYGTHRWVKVDNKWGLVGADGNFAVNPIYDEVQTEGTLQLSTKLPTEETDVTYKVTIDEDEYRLSFQNGDYKQSPFKELKKDRSQMLNCKGGYKRKSKDGLWGLIDKNGDDFIAPLYRAISCFSSGVAWVPDDTKGQWCPIDKNGRMRSSPPCNEAYYNTYVSHHSPEKLHDNPYESNVLWMRAWLDYGEDRRSEKPKMVPWEYD